MAQTPEFPDFYFDLGVHRDATPNEIKKAFAEKVKQFHPDHHQNDPAAEERTKRLTLAYDTLKDPEKRTAYDKALQDHYDRLKNPSPPPPPPPPQEEPVPAKESEEPASVPPRPSRPRRANWFLLRALVVTVIFSFFYFHYHEASPPSSTPPSQIDRQRSPSPPHLPPSSSSHLSAAEMSTIIVGSVTTMTLDPERIVQEINRAIDHSGFRPHGSDGFWTLSVSIEGQWGPVTTTGHTYTLAGEVTLTGKDGLQLSHHIAVTTFWPMGGDAQDDLQREERMFGAKVHRWLLAAHRQILGRS